MFLPRARRLQQNLKTIGDGAFQDFSKLEDVQLASSSIFFGRIPLVACERLIELAAAASFPSNTIVNSSVYGTINTVWHN